MMSFCEEALLVAFQGVGLGPLMQTQISWVTIHVILDPQIPSEAIMLFLCICVETEVRGKSFTRMS